ncbi:MAG: DMT family transporter [Deltaproteobacteria bacterium]|nr:DMT family transporter [Deltaproteobacteria bacterium]
MLSGLLMVTLAAASWGTWSLFLRPTGLPSEATTPVIFLVMGLVTLPLALRGPRSIWDRKTVGLLLASSAFDALNVLTFFAAIETTTIAIAVLTHYVAPILIALAAPSIDRIRTPGARPAAVVALLGLVVILEPWREAAPGATLGAILGLSSAVCYTGNVFAVRRLAQRIGATRAMSYHSLIVAVVATPLLVVYGNMFSTTDLALLAVGAATIGAGSGIAFAIGLIRIGSARAAVLTFAEPIVAVVVGVVAWHEPLRPLAAVGGAMVLGAGIYVARKVATS